MIDKDVIEQWLAEFVGNSNITNGIDPYLYLYSAWDTPALIEDIQKLNPTATSMDELNAEDIIEAMKRHDTDPTITNSNGTKFDLSQWDAIINSINDSSVPVETLSEELWPCPAQELFTAYAKSYEEEYKEEWEWDKANPVV